MPSVDVGRGPRHALGPKRADPAAGSGPDAGSRLAALDVARGVAILSVVLLHSADWLSNGRFSMNAWIDANGIMIGLRMPVFFVVSGLLTSRWRAESLRRLVSRKVVVLLWLYFAWQLVGTAVGPIESQIKGEQSRPLRMLASLLATPVIPRLELWYLWALAVALVLAHLTVRVPLRAQLLVSGVVAAYSVSSLAPVDNPAWLGLPSFYVFFLLGYHFPSAPVALAERARRNLALAPALIAVYTVVSVGAYLVGVDFWMGPAFVIYGLGVVTLLAAGGWLAGVHLLQYLGARTLPIYVAHTPVIVLLVRAVQPYRDTTVLAAVTPVLPVVLCVVTVPLTLALHAVLRRTPARVLYTPPAWLVPLASRLVERGPRQDDDEGGAASMQPSPA